MNWIKMLVADQSGDPSTMRICVLLVVFGVITNWVYLTIHTGQPQVLDWSQVGLIVGSLTAKAVQTKLEPVPSTPVTITSNLPITTAKLS